jgi:Trypsin-like peptidase domain
MALRLGRISPLVVLAFVPSGCSGQDPHAVLPTFRDVSDAPPAIRIAAEAVVRIATAGEIATGSFITPTGVLLTNNHVLGVTVCPREGCYAKITFMYQRNATVQEPKTVFVVPMAVSAGLDMAAVQVYSDAGGSPLDTPQYLALKSLDAGSLLGTHVHVVGHPEGHLKKWAQGDVANSDGTWLWFTAYSLPGNSGSPILDDEGHMVGILHSGPTSQDLVSNQGVDEYSIGTASAALIAAMAAPLPAAMRSTQDPVTDEEVAQFHAVYLNARAGSAIVNGAPRPVLSSLGAQCDAALAKQSYASPTDLADGLAPCLAAGLWIECRADATPGGFGVCPPDASAWAQRYASVYGLWLAFNGELMLDMVSFGPAALAMSKDSGVSTGAGTLAAALSTAGAPLDFRTADYLAAFDIASYSGASVLDFLHGYAKSPGYFLSGTFIASAALWLNSHRRLSGPDTLSFLRALAGDDRVDIGTKLYIEDVLYGSGAL